MIKPLLLALLLIFSGVAHALPEDGIEESEGKSSADIEGPKHDGPEKQAGLRLSAMLEAAPSADSRDRVEQSQVNAEALFRSSVPGNLQTWTFAQIAQLAIQEHPAVLSRRSFAEAAKADLSYAEWQRFPTLSASVNKGWTAGDQNKVISVQQPLYTGGRIASTISGAESRYSASIQSGKEVEINILIATVNAVAEAARWQTRKQLSAENLEQHRRLYEMIQRRVHLEASSAVDLELAQGRLYQAEIELSHAEQSLTSTLMQLSQLAGTPVSGVSAQDGGMFGAIPDLDECLAQARTGSPMLARLLHEAAAAEADVAVKEAVYSPQLSMRYEKQAGPAVYNTDRLMMVVDMQTGAGLSAFSGVAAANARLDAARLERERAERDLIQQVSVDWSSYKAARAYLGNAYKANLSSSLVSDSYARQYTAGRKSWLDVLNAVRESSQSRALMVDAYSQMSASGMRLLVLTGKINAAELLSKGYAQ